MAVTLKRTLDYEDNAGIPPDRNRYEIIDGHLFVTPAPSPLRQRVSRRSSPKPTGSNATGSRLERP